MQLSVHVKRLANGKMRWCCLKLQISWQMSSRTMSHKLYLEVFCVLSSQPCVGFLLGARSVLPTFRCICMHYFGEKEDQSLDMILRVSMSNYGL